MGPREVFLSHSHRGRTFASRLSETLRRHGVPVWYSRDRIQGAQQWHDEIGKALNRYQKRIAPLLRRKCRYDRLSWTLDGMQRIDFTADFGAGCRALLRVWGIGYEQERASRRRRGRGVRPHD